MTLILLRLLALTLRAFWSRRAQFNQLISSNGSLTISRYFRLMLLSCLEISCTLPLSIFSVYINNKGVTLAPWVSWADTHFNFSFIQPIPAAIWKSDRSFEISVEMSRWIFPACALIFFMLFGFAGEAQRNYRKVLQPVLKYLKIDFPKRRMQQPKGYGYVPHSFVAWDRLLICTSRKYTGQKSSDSTDCLPVYTPPSPSKFSKSAFSKSAFSVATTLGGSEAHAEKDDFPFPFTPGTQNYAMPTPPSPVYSEGETVVSSPLDHETRIIVSDEFPASRPPSPPATQPPSPTAARSFVSPTLRTMSSLLSLNSHSAPADVDTIVVAVHTESRMYAV